VFPVFENFAHLSGADKQVGRRKPDACRRDGCRTRKGVEGPEEGSPRRRPGRSPRDYVGRLAETSLDEGAELDTLAAMPAGDRVPPIQRAAAGENVSALRPALGQEPKSDYSELTRTFKAFRSASRQGAMRGEMPSDRVLARRGSLNVELAGDQL
jgi:hypothetical protein